ncbi:hypothetical protein Bca4012_027569 [Brassica carinata]|uniref:Uncharacterized protein n=1 Tax=Brassica carinata TaxID=52824 RepID=A0A8X8AWU3_BRACI|nr:hypothetical protein Bca52824_024529 [Brassica carinata]
MSFNGKSMVSGASKSEKPKGADTDSFPVTTKPNGTPCVSSDLSIGDPHSKNDKVESSVSSSTLSKPSCNTGVSSGVSIGRPNSKRSNGVKPRMMEAKIETLSLTLFVKKTSRAGVTTEPMYRSISPSISELFHSLRPPEQQFKDSSLLRFCVELAARIALRL